jgi:alcohol dehydrogenase
MKNFTFQNQTKIIFGRNAEEKLGKEIKKYSQKILLHYGGGSIKKIGLYERVRKILKEENIDYIELSGVKPNPRLSLIKKGIDICRKENISFILAVGGGSVIDSSKAIAAGVTYPGDVWDLCLGKGEVTEPLPVGTILTIPAAGSESSPAAVITNEEGWLKLDVQSEELRPKFSILNPENTFSLPKYQTIVGIADIMAHLMERYFTQELHVDLSDRLIEGNLQSVIKHAPLVLNNPADYNSRAEIMWAGTVAHNDLFSSGRVGDWASHKIEHELSALYDIPHGAGLAVIMPAWMKYVYKDNINKFAQFAHRVWHIDPDFEKIEKTALNGIERLQSFFKEHGLPVTLKDLGIADDRFREMARRCTSKGAVGNFKKLNENDVFNIYQLAK